MFRKSILSAISGLALVLLSFCEKNPVVSGGTQSATLLNGGI